MNNGKGDKNRTSNYRAFWDHYDYVFRKKKEAKIINGFRLLRYDVVSEGFEPHCAIIKDKKNETN